MKADERPVGSEHVRLELLDLGAVADHERDTVRTQQLVHGLGEPARVAELEAVASGRERCQRRRQPVVVALERRRQLPQHRAELRRADERLHPFVVAGEPAAHVGQALGVRQVAAGLDREEKARRRLLDPPRHRGLQRQSVERGVHLDGVEVLRVALQPEARRLPLVELVPPGRVVPAGAAYPESAAASC
jgi:hypothetical protein